MMKLGFFFCVFVSVVFVANLPSAFSANCPGALVTRVPALYLDFPTNLNWGVETTSSPILIGLKYHEPSQLLYASYSSGYLGLAAWNVTKMLAGITPAWEAAILTKTASTALKGAQNIEIDQAQDRIILTTNDATESLAYLKLSAFLNAGVTGNPATAIQSARASISLGSINCRGLLMDPANDGSYWVTCESNIYKFSSNDVVLVNQPIQLPGGIFHWGITIDPKQNILWATISDNLNTVYGYNILPNNGGLTNFTSFVVGDVTRGIVFDPNFDELYTVKRNTMYPAVGSAVIRYKAYNPGFSIDKLSNPFSFFRANAAAWDPQSKLFFATSTDENNGVDPVNNTYIHIFDYQHAGCQCRADNECDTSKSETCFKGTCVNSGGCQPCQVGIQDGSCVGIANACVTSTNATTFETQITFDGPSPQHTLKPLNNPLLALDVRFERLEENIPTGGLPIQSLSLLSLPYNITGPFADTFTTQNFEVAYSGALGDISWIFSLLDFNTSAARNFAGVSFTQEPTTTKWTINISNWAWAVAGDTLTLRVRLLSEDGAFTSASRVDSSSLTTYTLTTQNSVITIKLINVALVDGVQKPISSTFFTENTVLLLTFPYFTNSLIYDPDFGVVVASSSSDGGDGTDSVLIIVLSVVIPSVVIPIMLLMVVLVAIYLITYYRRKSLRGYSGKRDSINTDSFAYAAEAAEEDNI